MKGFRVGRVFRPIDGAYKRLRLLLNVFDQRPKAVRLLERTVYVREPRGYKPRLQIAIEERARPCRRNQRGEEILVQPPPANDVHVLVVSTGKRADYGERKRHSLRQF